MNEFVSVLSYEHQCEDTSEYVLEFHLAVDTGGTCGH
jgi:hypothetical protein